MGMEYSDGWMDAIICLVKTKISYHPSDVEQIRRNVISSLELFEIPIEDAIYIIAGTFEE